MKHITVHITIMAFRDLTQDERNWLRRMFPTDKSWSSRSNNDLAGYPKEPRLADLRTPTVIDALDLELPTTWAENVKIIGHSRVVEIIQQTWDNTLY